ncbi:MAG TPA: hypothetical protein P5556_10650 [Candidatus Gastranaerophilales bacterium]|nr:hypothetical protein [Candidatus Gastranaerophilales bacterium]
MSYKNDHMLTIANQYGKASSDAKAVVFETYDKLRDLTVSGSGLGGGTAYGNIGQFFMNLSKLIGPSNYMPVLGNSSINIPGTSYSSPISGGYSTIPGVQSAFGMNNVGKYPGFPSGGAASLDSALGLGSLGISALMGLGSYYTPLAGTFSIGGMPTGGASALSSSIPGGNSFTPAAGVLTGIGAVGGKYSDITLPVAGLVGGFGGLVQHLAPYFGPSGLVAALAGNLMSGYSGAAISTYNYISSRIITNADTILTMKIKNLETTVKQLDTQSDIVKKMLKSSIEGDSKAVSDL